jgi:hypothetical protein
MKAAFVFVQMAVSRWGGCRSCMASCDPGVKTVHFLAGPTDVILFAEGRSGGAAETIGKVRGQRVESTDTRIVWPV